MKEDNSQFLHELKLTLVNATGRQAESIIREYIQEQLQILGLDKHQSSIVQLFQLLYNITPEDTDLTSFLLQRINDNPDSKNSLKIKVRNWLANKSSDDPWVLLAKLEKRPNDSANFTNLNYYVKPQVRKEKTRLIQEALESDLQWYKSLSPFGKVVTEVLENDKDNILGFELYQKNVNEQHRMDIIKKVLQKCEEEKLETSYIHGLLDIRSKAEISLSQNFMHESPNYNKDINSLLAFLLAPMDIKRICQLCAAWENVDAQLALSFHAALVGYRYLGGEAFRPFWDAVAIDETTGVKIGDYLFKLICAEPQVENSDVPAEQFAEVESENVSEEQSKLSEPTESGMLVLSEDDNNLQEKILLLFSKNKSMTAKKIIKQIGEELEIEQVLNALEKLSEQGSVKKPKNKMNNWHLAVGNDPAQESLPL